MNKCASFAGTFYPENPDELNNLLNSFKIDKNKDYKSKAIIVPHAGYVFSGHAAMAGFQMLAPSENIFVIAPSHHNLFNDIALPKYTFFETPLGSIEVNNRLIKDIAEKFPCIISNDFFDDEHSIEVQLPFLQNILCPQHQSAAEFVKNITKFGRKFKIIPILIGKCDYKLISDIIKEYWDIASFVISSDLSHFFSQEECRQIDTYTATLIETGKIECFEPAQACGLIGIKGLIDFANKNNYSMIRLEMYNSGDVCTDKNKVVGYGSWYLYEAPTNELIENEYKNYVLKMARSSIESVFSNTEFLPSSIPQVLTQLGASFVTLKINGTLRGCIGSIFPTKPLIIDILDNAKNAAFQDYRFESLKEDELKNTEISVSILSKIERINFKDEKDLLSKIYPHGIIISEHDKRSVYLPVVWEQLPDKEIFFNSLKEKAGLPFDYFSKSMEVYKFDAIYLTEN